MQLIQLMIHSIFVTFAHAIIAYDCAHERINVTTLSLLSVKPCTIIKPEITQQNEDIQLLQMSEVATLHIYQCKINIIQSVHYCGMFSHLSLVPGGLSTFLEDISREDCMKIHHFHTYKLQNGRIIANIKTNATTTHTEIVAGNVDSTGKCSGVPYTSGTNSWDGVIVTHAMEFTITDYQSSVRLEDNMVLLRNNVLCQYLAGKCIDPDYGLSFWDLIPDQSCEHLKYDVLWQGIATKISRNVTHEGSAVPIILYTVTSGEIMFALEVKSSISVCRFDGYQTEHPRLVVVPRAARDYWFKKKAIDVRNLDLLTYVNSKFVYSERHIKSQVEQLYTNILSKKCELERETLKTRLMIAPHHPAEFSLMHTNEQGYIAVPRGEIIYLVKCQPADVTIRKTDRCYLELPVTYNNQSYFMSPITHLLLNHGTEVQCSDFLSPGYHVNGEWYGFNPRLHRIKHPAELRPSFKPDWQFEDPANLIEAGIYSKPSIDSLRHQIMYPSERQAVQNIITQSIMGQDIDHQSLETTNLFSTKGLELLGKTMREKVWGLFSGIGNFCTIVLVIYVGGKVIKFIIDVFCNFRALRALYGWSWKLAAASWNSATNHILHQQHNTRDMVLQEVVTIPPESFERANSTPQLQNYITTHDQNHCNEDAATTNRFAALYPALPK